MVALVDIVCWRRVEIYRTLGIINSVLCKLKLV
jgi:hypothetical protein